VLRACPALYRYGFTSGFYYCHVGSVAAVLTSNILSYSRFLLPVMNVKSVIKNAVSYRDLIVKMKMFTYILINPMGTL